MLCVCGGGGTCRRELSSNPLTGTPRKAATSACSGIGAGWIRCDAIGNGYSTRVHDASFQGITCSCAIEIDEPCSSRTTVKDSGTAVKGQWKFGETHSEMR